LRCESQQDQPLQLTQRGAGLRLIDVHAVAVPNLAHRAMAGYHEGDYNLCEGEILCATVLGWNFGDGHMHDECLIEALQQRCGFEPGEVPVVP
jgi:Transmembrane protein of unknown function (DUF3556)